MRVTIKLCLTAVAACAAVGCMRPPAYVGTYISAAVPQKRTWNYTLTIRADDTWTLRDPKTGANCDGTYRVAGNELTLTRPGDLKGRLDATTLLIDEYRQISEGPNRPHPATKYGAWLTQPRKPKPKARVWPEGGRDVTFLFDEEGGTLSVDLGLPTEIDLEKE